MIVVVIAIYILSFLMAFSVGANDAANSLGTLYGSNALRLVYIVAIGAIFEFIGAVWCSSKVTDLLTSKIILGLSESDGEDTELQTFMMLGSSIAAFLFTMSSSIFGMPISGTHAVVGGLVGAGLVGYGSGGIGWGVLVKIVASWFVSPVVSGSLCCLLLLLVSSLTLRGFELSLKMRTFFLTLLTGLCFVLINFMLISLIQDRDSVHPAEYLSLIASFLLGYFGCRILLLCHLGNSFCEVLCKAIAFWDFSVFEKRTNDSDKAVTED